MPTRFESATPSCPVTRPVTNPIIVPLGFPGGILRKIRIYIPAGHAGLTGISLGYGNNPTVPSGVNAYYSGDNREIILDYVDNVPGVNWSAFVCNLDGIGHVWEVDFDFDETDVSNATTTIAPLSPATILNAGVGATV